MPHSHRTAAQAPAGMTGSPRASAVAREVKPIRAVQRWANRRVAIRLSKLALWVAAFIAER